MRDREEGKSATMARNRIEVVFTKAIERYGKEAQKMKAIEELGELVQAVARDLEGHPDPENIAEEMADVSIMLDQLQEIYQNAETVELIRKLKARRLLYRMRAEKGRDDGL